MRYQSVAQSWSSALNAAQGWRWRQVLSLRPRPNHRRDERQARSGSRGRAFVVSGVTTCLRVFAWQGSDNGDTHAHFSDDHRRSYHLYRRARSRSGTAVSWMGPLLSPRLRRPGLAHRARGEDSSFPLGRETTKTQGCLAQLRNRSRTPPFINRSAGCLSGGPAVSAALPLLR